MGKTFLKFEKRFSLWLLRSRNSFSMMIRLLKHGIVYFISLINKKQF